MDRDVLGRSVAKTFNFMVAGVAGGLISEIASQDTSWTSDVIGTLFAFLFVFILALAVDYGIESRLSSEAH